MGTSYIRYVLHGHYWWRGQERRGSMSMIDLSINISAIHTRFGSVGGQANSTTTATNGYITSEEVMFSNPRPTN